MVLPIVAYGNSILRKQCREVEPHDNTLMPLLENMWQTMYGARGCGLAAPQVNEDLKVFIVDGMSTYKNMSAENRKVLFDGDTGIRETFINARITEYSRRIWTDEEGCLSIPTLSAEVERSWSIHIEYLDASFQPQSRVFSGATARMIQHEYDHIEGILYLDYLKPLKRTMLKGKLDKIMKGKIKAPYPMSYSEQ